MEDKVATEVSQQISPETKREFEQIIKSSGAEIISPKKYDLPQTYDFSELSENDKELVKQSVRALTNFLNLPIIFDKFEDHDERRKWRKQTFDAIANKYNLEKANLFDEFLKRNKMKRNKIATVMGYCDFLKDDGFAPEDVTNELMTTIKGTLPTRDTEGKTHDPWEGPTTQEKIETIDEISDYVAQILNYLATNPPRSKIL